MSSLRLLMPASDEFRLDPERDVLWISADRIPKLVKLERVGDELVLSDTETQSGTLHLSAWLRGVGPVVLQTAIMMLGHKPYRLAVELARGQANKVRNLLAEWEREGWSIPDEIVGRTKALAKRLCPAIQSLCPQKADAAALDLVREIMTHGDELAVANAGWQLSQPERCDRKLDIGFLADDASRLSACRSDRPEEVGTILIPIDWSKLEIEDGTYDWSILDGQIDAALEANLRPMVGPILDFRTGSLPRWITQCCHDRDCTVTLLVDLVETVVGRYAGRVDRWIVTGATNSTRDLSLNEDELRSLTLHLCETARGMDSSARLAVGIDQPFGWYAGSTPGRCWPVEFLDALARRGVQADAFYLRLDLGTDQENLNWTPLDVSKLLDRYRRLPKPLWIQIEQSSMPERPEDDLVRFERTMTVALAKPFVEQVSGQLRSSDPSHPCPNGQSQPSPDWDWVRRLRSPICL